MGRKYRFFQVFPYDPTGRNGTILRRPFGDDYVAPAIWR